MVNRKSLVPMSLIKFTAVVSRPALMPIREEEKRRITMNGIKMMINEGEGHYRVQSTCWHVLAWD